MKNAKKIVRERYGKIAKTSSSCCSSGCGCGAGTADIISRNIGYSEQDISSVPEGANLGLGCGNPIALASLKKGETVLDLGSGAGFDCFLAAKKVGDGGKIIGVDMTPEMLEKARLNAEKGKYSNVEFRLGEIENLPVADNSVDVVISNCVINLSTEKERVFREAFRVLRQGGRLMVSDIVLLKEIPKTIRESAAAYTSCISGAMLKKDYLGALRKAGFKDVKVVQESNFPLDSMINDLLSAEVRNELNFTDEDIRDISKAIVSVKVSAVKGEK